MMSMNEKTPTQDELLQVIKLTPEKVEFSDVMACIDANYRFVETAFVNGSLNNKAGENNGSCQLFAFAQLQGLDKAQTLACFGTYYRDDVMQNPQGDDHQNIRNFMQTGWEGIQYSQQALLVKS